MVSTQFPNPLKKTFNMEMQEQSILNEMMCDEIHEIEDANGQQDYRGPMTRSRAKTLETIETSMGENHDQNEEVSQEGLPILVHIEKYEGGPVYSTFLQKEIEKLLMVVFKNTLCQSKV